MDFIKDSHIYTRVYVQKAAYGFVDGIIFWVSIFRTVAVLLGISGDVRVLTFRFHSLIFFIKMP